MSVEPRRTAREEPAGSGAAAVGAPGGWSELHDALLPFQREGVARGIAFEGRVLIGDEMGLGKTLQAIAIALHYRAEWPLLVLCPTSLVLPWCEELERWCPDLAPGDINPIRSVHNSAMATAPVSIISYGVLTNGKEKEQVAANVLAAGFRVVIADEAHYLKSRDAQRTKLALPLLAAARRALLLTGTPALSRPVELFTLVSTLRPGAHPWRQYTAYVHEYCDARIRFMAGGRRRLDVSGSSNEGALHAELNSRLMVRRRKADVLSQLPPKRRTRVLVELDAKRRAVIDALERQGAADADDGDGGEFGRMRLLSKMVVELASAKAAHAAEYAVSLAEDGECKVLYFGHHMVTLDAAERAAAARRIPCLRIDGTTVATERQRLVAQFEATPSGKPALFALSITAAGVGLNLTSASTVVFGELRWVPGELLQAEDRAHRIGQNLAVNCHYVVAKDTVDETMWQTLQRKVRSLASALDGSTGQLSAQAAPWEPSADPAAPRDDCAAEVDGAAALLDARAARARREKEAAAERKRSAFEALFAPRGSQPSQARAGQPSPRPAAGSAAGGPATIDLTGDDPASSGAAFGSAPPPSACAATPSTSASAPPKRASTWFAMSALTGRLHAFGSGSAPVAQRANAQPWAIREEDVRALPPAFHDPAVLRAAQRWLSEWGALTAAQRTSLHDRPVLSPARHALSPARGPAAKARRGAAGAGGGSAVSSGVGVGVGVGVGESVQRETSAACWAEAHRPSTPHSTMTWTTTTLREERTWTQHFSLVDARPHCLYCVAVHAPQVDSPFCSEACARAFAVARSQTSARAQLFERDRGVCAACGLDAHALYRAIAALPPGPRRLGALLDSTLSTMSDRLRRCLDNPKEGDFWEADHLRAVADGGGESDLSNYQTLCTRCHAAKSTREAAARKKRAAAAGSADLRSFFIGGASS